MTAMKRRSLRTLAPIAVLALLPALAACDSTKRALGYEKAAPDEFQVVQRAPLVIPPDFSLRPPQPGAVRPQEGTPRDQARAALLGVRQTAPISAAGRDTADVALLKRAGADQIQPNIRDLVDKESTAIANANKSFTDKLIFWRKPEGAGAGEQLDAQAEAQRLSQNQALGRAVTEGESPRIERRRKGMLEGIF